MERKEENAAMITGGCLCGAVRYQFKGPMRDVVNCHCSKCRRFHGHFGAYTSIRREDLNIIKSDGLKWYRSVKDETPNVYRGFCKECGSSLFWDPRGGREHISITAGTLDATASIKTIGHVWVSQAAGYYQITDGLVQYDKSWGVS